MHAPMAQQLELHTPTRFQAALFFIKTSLQNLTSSSAISTLVSFMPLLLAAMPSTPHSISDP
jgi:hypothetical protein